MDCFISNRQCTTSSILYVRSLSHNQNFRSKKFHFESRWTLEESTEQVIKEAWETNWDPLMEKLGNLQNKLKMWARSYKNKREDRKKRLAKELEFLLNEERDDEIMAKIINTKIHLNM
ncbi:hypothetical protein EPI10_014801 [Gossypium australe]|uniref:Reverse transcriptase n=1 Tax=Gossypium australe TaxID=47621 RepID=A0A5B6VIU0_9ROSI|nr:hypothetical protein EPI10_014801 [Gossypium australe]